MLTTRTRTRLLALALPGLVACGGADFASGPDVLPIEEVELSEEENALVNAKVQRAIDYGLSVRGTPYGWWTGGGIPTGAPMWAANEAAPAPSYVKDRSVNCAGLTNLMLRAVNVRLPSDYYAGTGGTGAYGRYYANVAQRFDPSREYPAGTLIGRRYRDVYDQGHVAVVLGNGKVLQSYATRYGGTYPGANDWWTVRESHAGYFYEYAVLPRHWIGFDCAYGDGLYCGGNGTSGASDTLYRCTDGVGTKVRACADGCVREAAGVDDHCR